MRNIKRRLISLTLIALFALGFVNTAAATKAYIYNINCDVCHSFASMVVRDCAGVQSSYTPSKHCSTHQSCYYSDTRYYNEAWGYHAGIASVCHSNRLNGHSHYQKHSNGNDKGCFYE